MKLHLISLICVVVLAAGASFAQSKESDREFAGLKGKVKSVLTETADAKLKNGQVAESHRRKAEDSAFRLEGDAEKTTYYTWDTGIVREITTYIQVDGDKASVSKMGPGAITGTMVGSVDDKPSKPSDPRYEVKLKYKYDDQGRISEETWLENDGELWLRYVYEHVNGERRETVFDKEGKLNQKYDYKLDAKGNDVEMISYDPKSGKVEGKEKYEYLSFDSHGNWTKRVEYESENGDDSKFKIREVKYRTLTYYP